MNKHKLSLNDIVYVKLTQKGHDIHRQQHEDLVDTIRRRSGTEPDLKYLPVDEDEQGLSKWQLWDLMQTFGPHIGAGIDAPIEINIFFKLEFP